MKPNMLRIVAVMCLLTGCLCQAATGRQWLDKKQGKRFEAEFVRVLDGTVVFMRGVRTQTMPLVDLGDKDQEYIRREMESRGKPWLVASPESLRTWTDTQGRTNSAMFIRMIGRDVLLGNTKGTYQVPFELLSAGDQDFLRLELTAQGKADQLPAESLEEAFATRLAKMNEDVKDKPAPKEAVGGVVGGRPFDADLAADVKPSEKPASKAGDGELASIAPPGPPTGKSAAADPKEMAPKETAPKETAPKDAVSNDASPEHPAKTEKQPNDNDVASLLDLGASASPQKPGAAAAPAAVKPPAPPALDPSIKGFPYCSRCKRPSPGQKPGGPCTGCGKPLDLFQNLDGSIEEVEGLGFWSQYGTMIIVGVVCVVGFIGFRAWKGGGSE
jgi:hypothetical protein